MERGIDTVDVTVDASQVAELAADLIGAGPKAAAGVRPLVRRAAVRTQRLAQAFAPKRTGFLASTIQTTSGSTGATGRVAATAPYAAFVEYGTSKMAAEPFMRPAADAVTPAFVNDAQQLADRALP
jgi:HK97 gp10 family phage protein